MAIRLVGAALLGGLLMFVWGAVMHMLTPLGTAGKTKVADEVALSAAVEASAPQPGFYYFPWMEKGADAAAQQAWTERYKKGPSGLLVVQERGREPMDVRRLAIEFGSNVAAAFVLGLVVLVSGMRSFAGRLFVGILLGLFSWLSVEVSYWNWYGFPSPVTQATLIEQTVCGLLAGLGVALVLKPKP